MALQTSGAISLQDIGTEFNDAQPHAINEFYGVYSSVPSSGEISFDDFYGAVALTSHTLSSNTANLNVYDYAVANGYTGGPYQLTINSGVIVYSTYVNDPALQINGTSSQGFASGTEVTIINNGTVYGGPGSGASQTTGNAVNGANGSKGGTAVQVQPTGNSLTNIVTFNNNGTVKGGGGGGGAGGSGNDYTATTTTTVTEGPQPPAGTTTTNANYGSWSVTPSLGQWSLSWAFTIGSPTTLVNASTSNHTRTSYSTGGWTYYRGSSYFNYTPLKDTIYLYYVTRQQSQTTTTNYSGGYGGYGGFGGYYDSTSLLNGTSGQTGATSGPQAQGTGGNGGSGGNVGIAGSNGSNAGGSATGGTGGEAGHYYHVNATASGSGGFTFTNSGTVAGTTA